jgi:polyhydroxyalkanoate synthesis regulator phasin
MVRDALRTYLSLASGLVDVPRQQAVRAARALVSQGEATAEQAGSIAEDLLGTSRANRDALRQLIRYEVDRGLGRLGLATSEDVRDLTNRVRLLETELRTLRGSTAGKTAPAKKAPAKKESKSAAAATPGKVAKKASKAAPAKTTAKKTASATGSGRQALTRPVPAGDRRGEDNR